jgi:adenylate cyclase
MVKQNGLLSESLLENRVAHFLQNVAARSGAIIEQPPVGPDFIVTQSDGLKTIIEVRSHSRGVATYKRIKNLLEKAPSASNFLLVTFERPTNSERDEFNSNLADLPYKCDWVPLVDLPAKLEMDLEASSLFSKSLKQLIPQTAASLGSELPEFLSSKRSQLPYLENQLSTAAIEKIGSDDESVEVLLRLGQPVQNATVVLSDLYNFSELVTASTPELL